MKTRSISGWTLAFILVGGFCAVTIFLGCLGTGGHTIKVIPDPDDSEIFVDDNQVGKGVTEVTLKDETKKYQIRVCGPAGYFCRNSTVDYRSPTTMEITPPKDNAYFDTIDGVDVVNKWIQVEVSSKYTPEEAWQKITSSLTTAISDFEVLDQKSFYLKSAWKVAGQKGDQLRARSRIVVSVENPDPTNLVFKIRIESERTENGERTEDYPRTFRTFIDALNDTRARLK